MGNNAASTCMGGCCDCIKKPSRYFFIGFSKKREYPNQLGTGSFGLSKSMLPSHFKDRAERENDPCPKSIQGKEKGSLDVTTEAGREENEEQLQKESEEREEKEMDNTMAGWKQVETIYRSFTAGVGMNRGNGSLRQKNNSDECITIDRRKYYVRATKDMPNNPNNGAVGMREGEEDSYAAKRDTTKIYAMAIQMKDLDRGGGNPMNVVQKIVDDEKKRLNFPTDALKSQLEVGLVVFVDMEHKESTVAARSLFSHLRRIYKKARYGAKANSGAGAGKICPELVDSDTIVFAMYDSKGADKIETVVQQALGITTEMENVEIVIVDKGSLKSELQNRVEIKGITGGEGDANRRQQQGVNNQAAHSAGAMGMLELKEPVDWQLIDGAWHKSTSSFDDHDSSHDSSTPPNTTPNILGVQVSNHNQLRGGLRTIGTSSSMSSSMSLSVFWSNCIIMIVLLLAGSAIMMGIFAWRSMRKMKNRTAIEKEESSQRLIEIGEG